MNELTIEDRRRLWKSTNRGELKRIAKRVGKSASFVGQVFNKRRGNVLIEQELKRLMAPGFEESK